MKLIAFLGMPSEKIEEYLEGWQDRLPKGEGLKIVVPPHIMPEPFNGIHGYVIFETDSPVLAVSYLSEFEKTGVKVRLSYSWEDSELAKELAKFQEQKKEAEQEWAQTTVDKITDLGSTTRLEILPLVEWHKSREDLQTETGVSYLVRTDENTILFDLGVNSQNRDPSPLLHNMNKLGIGIDDFDTIVISHNHGDHVGGGKWARDKTFSITANQIPLTGKRAYTPVPMTYPGLTPIYSKTPTTIGKGITTLGTISRSIFSMGLTPEQALAVNIKGKGIVLIVGCGHQTLPRILTRAETLFNQPICGIVGGLHYPVEGGPVEYMGMAPHKFGGTGKPPWQQITAQELQASIDLLKDKKLKLIALSPHDSSPKSLEAFRRAFPETYRDIRVGQPIIVSACEHEG